MTASTANFLDGGELAAPTVKPPAGAKPLTEAQRAANARAAIQQQARATAARNAAYRAGRAADAKVDAEYRARMLADPGPAGQRYRAQEKLIKSAGVDWGLIPAGAAVLAAGAAIIASGGVLAGAIAAPSAATIAGAAVAADRALAAAEKAKLAPKGAAGRLTAVVDAGKKAQAILDNTVELAKQGVAGAVDGAKIIAETAAKRALSGALPGVPMPVTESGAKAFDAYVQQLPALKQAVGAGYAAPIVQRPVATVARPPAGGAALATLQLSGVRPRWLVTLAGKVDDLYARPEAAANAGFVVWSTGKVERQ